MINFGHIANCGGYTEAELTETWPQLANERIRRFGTNWIVISGIYPADGDQVWYIYERIDADVWWQRSYGEKRNDN